MYVACTYVHMNGLDGKFCVYSKNVLTRVFTNFHLADSAN